MSNRTPRHQVSLAAQMLPLLVTTDGYCTYTYNSMQYDGHCTCKCWNTQIKYEAKCMAEIAAASDIVMASRTTHCAPRRPGAQFWLHVH